MKVFEKKSNTKYCLSVFKYYFKIDFHVEFKYCVNSNQLH